VNAQHAQQAQQAQDTHNLQETKPIQSYTVLPAEVAPRRQGGGIVLPVLLIGLGILFLLSTFEVMDWSSWGNIWRLWPLVLVAFGLEILVGRRSALGSLLIAGLLIMTLALTLALWAWQPYSGQTLTSETIAQSLQGVSDASVTLEFGAGRLQVNGLTDSDSLVAGTVRRGNNETVAQYFHVSEGIAYYTLKSETDWVSPFFNGGERSWDLRLSASVPTNLTINTGVGEATLDFEELNLTSLDLKIGAGDTVVTLPAQGSFNANLDAGVGNVTVRIPEEMPARIRVDSGLGNVEVAGDYPRQGGYYVSPGYDEARERVDLDINAGVGNITISQAPAEP